MGELPYPAVVDRSRVKIEQLPFIRYVETGSAFAPDTLSDEDVDRIAERLIARLEAAGIIIARN